VSISKRISVRYAFEDGLPAVEVDPAQVRQVVMNLLTNAGEAIGDRPGTVTMTTGRMHADAAYLAGTAPDPSLPAGDYVYLEVSDTGCGMDEETRARIFDPFFTTKFTGRGLGLAAVLGIMRGHRGAIRVASAPGSGTTFRVLFPAAHHVTAKVEAAPSDATGRRLTGTVLVVDDDENVRTVVRRMLETCGVTVVSAGDGRAGVIAHRRRAAEIDAVLLDMTMPDLGGEEVLREMRKVRADTPVFLISGFTEQEAMQRFSVGDLAGFIQKPFTRDALLSRLAPVLDAAAESLDALGETAPGTELRDAP
jgi:two-component system cell cycle sensor histidine kinase/response regulator CckA